jgi:hypothetical protein
MTDQTPTVPLKNKFARIALTLTIICYSTWAATLILGLLITVSSADPANGGDNALAYILSFLFLAALIFGILGLASMAAIAVAAVALIFGILGIRKANTLNKTGYKAALTATILSGIALIPGIYAILLVANQ